MENVIDFARVSMYRKVKEVEARIDELGAMIDASDDFGVRGPLKAKRYALSMKLAALQANLLPRQTDGG